MRPRFLVLVAFFALAPVPAVAAGCAPQHVAVTVKPLLGGSSINNQHRQSSMQELSGIGDGLHHGAAPLALGLALTRVVNNTRISAYLQQDSFGQGACGSLAALEVGFGFEPHTIYIPAEFAPQSCAYNAIYAHEAKHVAVDKAVLMEYLPMLQQRIEQTVAAIPPIQAGDTTAVQAELKAKIEQIMEAEMRAFSAARGRAQAQVDSVEEYAMVSQSCGGIMRQIVGR